MIAFVRERPFKLESIDVSEAVLDVDTVPGLGRLHVAGQMQVVCTFNTPLHKHRSSALLQVLWTGAHHRQDYR